jgi:hypothetical protein
MMGADDSSEGMYGSDYVTDIRQHDVTSPNSEGGSGWVKDDCRTGGCYGDHMSAPSRNPDW